MTGIALVTSIYGDYDTLVDPPEQKGVEDYIAVVDRFHEGCELWRQIVEPRPHMHPRMAAKVAKCRPDLYTDCRVTVWIDGGSRLLHHEVCDWAAGLMDEPIAQFFHPQRDDFHAEAEVSAGMKKYADQPVLEQADHYRLRGMPAGWGLWATGFIARDLHAFTRFGNTWLAEQLRWSYQDQVSEPFVLWKTDLRPSTLPGDLWHNPHVKFTGHAHDA